LTNGRPDPIFRVTATHSAPFVALATLTSTGAIVFTDVRCVPPCNRRVMAVPGMPRLQVSVIQNDGERSGRGRVLSCPRCKKLLEVIEHG
jgi:hypothetical protein